MNEAGIILMSVEDHFNEFPRLQILLETLLHLTQLCQF